MDIRLNPLIMTGLLLGATMTASAQKAEPSVEALPPQVHGVLQAMSAQLQSAKTFAVHADILVDEVLASGQLLQRTATLDVIAQRPGSVAGVLETSSGKRKLWIRDKTATLYDEQENVSATTKVPGKIGPAFDTLMDRFGVSMPLSDFFFENPYEALVGSVQTATYVGTAEVDGVDCHHLAFTQETIDWQLWIEEGGRPVPRRLLIIYKNSPGAPRYMATLRGVDLQTPLSPQVFKPVLPEDVTTIEFLEIRPEAIPE